MAHIVSFFGAVMLVMALMVSTALAQSDDATLFGEAHTVQTGHNSLQSVEMTSDIDPGYGGIDFTLPDNTTFADITRLSTDYVVTYGGCGGGSPRFHLGLIDPGDKTPTEKTLFVYIGKDPGYTCTPNHWQTSGDLFETGKFVDATQLGGFFYEPYHMALAEFGTYRVTGIQLVTDAGWMFENHQTVRADNIMINEEVFTFEPTREEARASCKHGGYAVYSGENTTPGPFANQRQCIQYFNKTL